MDYEGANENFGQDNGGAEGSAAQRAPVDLANAIILNAGPDNVVVLPDGASLASIHSVGRDLVIEGEDGVVYIIPDGAIDVPLIVNEGTAVPPMNLAALLVGTQPGGEGPTPGGNNQSSGGNFEVDPGAIQAAYDIGDLLPYTELFFPQPQEEEILPDVIDREPDVVIETPDNPIGVENAIATVAERGLPERNEGEPEGTADETDAETTSGTIIFHAEDGLSAIILNGVEITSIGQEFETPFGTLTITSINLATGEIGFSYTLADNLLGITEDGNFAVTVVDTDGDTANATLRIIVEDDGPIARLDTDTVEGGTFGPITGNVLDNDESGADDYPDGEEGVDAVTGFSNDGGSANPGDSLQGDYGVLTLNADGSYSYTRDYNTPGGVEDQFTYTIIDQDGTTSTTTLTITIEDAPNTVEIPSIGEGTVVEESGLPARGDPEEPEGTEEGADSETTSGTIEFTSPDGVAHIIISGVEINLDNDPLDSSDDQVVVDDATGKLVITGVTYDPVTGIGTIDYDYTLGDNTLGDNAVDGGNTTVSFPVEIVDLDGDSTEDNGPDNLVITIIDDVPTANDDSAAQDAENAPITVDVFANDVEGADGVALGTIALVENSLTGAGELVNNGDGTFTYTPALGEEGDENGQITFQYSITDGDGDESIATVTIDLLPDSTPEIGTEGGNTVYEAGLDGPPASSFEGSDSGSGSEATSGVIFISTGGDTVASLLINGIDVTAGGTVDGDYGTLTVTFDGTDYSYSYELDNNIADLAGDEVDSFALTVTDSDGDEADTTLDITVIDDVPTAVDDTDSLTEDGPVFTSGNVITDAEANGDNGADTTGADGAVVQNAGEIPGTYGTLVLGADGSYTYTLSAFGISQLSTLGDGEFFTEEFDYTLVDGDGDESEATLTITLNGSDDDVTVNGLDGAAPEVVLDEDDLANPGDDQGSDQSDPLFQDGSFGVTSPDGLDDVQVNSVNVVVDGAFVGPVEVANDGIYSVSITGWTPVFAADGVTVISATFDYTATLLDNTLAHDELGQDDIINMLAVTADDTDGSFDDAVLDVQIIDDVPTANDDGSLVSPIPVVEDTATDIDVFANDVEGADGVANGDIALETQASNGTAVYNGDGTFTYTPKAGYAGPDSFTYTITDGDGDTSTATVYVNVGADSEPEFNAGDAVVDEDGLPDANVDSNPLQVSPAETNSTEDNTDTVNFTVDFGNDTPADVDGAIAFINPDSLDGQLNSDGQSVDFALDGNGDLVGTVDGGATEVIRISLNAGTDNGDGTVDYSYTVTLSQPLDHTDDESENSALLSGVTIEVTDSDGTESTDSFTVTIVDDVPTANDDTYNQADQDGENTAVTGDVSTNDVEGVDAPATYALNGDHDGDGDLVFNTDGTFTYTPADGEEGTVTFSYTVTDTDGDSDTATVTINLEDDSTPAPDDAVAAVDDDALGGNAGAGSGDLDANAGEVIPPGSTSEAIYVGTFTADFGNDGPGTFTLIGMDGDTGTVGTEDVAYSYAGNVLTATIDGGDRDGMVLFTVAVNPTTGQYTVTLVNPVMHVDDDTNTENDASAVLTFTAIDSDDNDAVDGTLTITFDDDVPSAADDTYNQADQDGENTAVTGDVSDNDTAGADSPVSYALVLDSLTGEGELDFNPDGTFTYTPADGEEGTVTFSYTLTDADGDESTADVTINLEDDTTPTAGTVTARVDDDGLAGGNNPNSAVDDLDANTDGNNNDIVFTGTLTGDAGIDGPATFSLEGMDTLTGTAGLETVTYSWDSLSNTLTATITGGDRDGTDLFTVEITDVSTGAYTVTLLTNFLHDGGDDGELAGGVDSLDLTYTVSDTDTPADTADGTLTIEFGDDAPLDFTPDAGFLADETDALAPHPTITETLNLLIGADTPAQIEFSVADGAAVIDGNTGEAVSVGSDPLFFYTDPNTGDLYATTGTAWNDGTVGFVVELDATGTGSYTFTIMNDLSNGTTTQFNDLTSTAAGNVNFRGVGVDDPATTVDLLLSGWASGAAATVNTDSDSIGVANQSMDVGESLRIDFVTNMVTEGNTTGFGYDSHSFTSSFKQEIPQVQGAQSNTVSFKVWAVSSNLADTGNPDRDPTAGFTGDTIKTITEVTVWDYLTGQFHTEDISGLANGATEVLAFGMSVTRNADGSVTFSGVQEGDSYAISTGAEEFSAVVVQDSTGSFDLGVIEIGSFNAGEDIELSFDVTVTDEDGDTATGTIGVTVDQDGSGPPVTPIVLDMDVANDNELFVGTDAGAAYDYNGDGVKTQTAWIAAGAAILAYDANSDHMVTDASEFVFGGDGMTDLQAVAALYDSNANGMLDSGDDAYGKFGVWMDDGDGTAEAGEFVTLAEAHISSVELVSDGIGYDEVGGDVVVFGTASYTMDDGTVGTVADAGFYTGSEVDATMDALLALATDDGAQTTGDEGSETVLLASVEDAMSDVSGEAAVDAIVDQYLDESAVKQLAESGSTVHDLLDMGIANGPSAYHGLHMADATDEAAVLAATA